MNDNDATHRSRQRQAISALIDGDGGQADQACGAWRDDATARADWHAYHLIGEVMRSEDLPRAPQRDAAFLGRLRQRLALEPVVLAPAAPPGGAPRRHAWMAPVVVAAGFVAVAGVLVVTRVAAPGAAVPERSEIAAASPAGSGSGGVRPAALAPDAQTAVARLPALDGALIRSPELDRYLAAHRQYGNNSALAVPGGLLRSAAGAVPER